jgi:hypothetical protein
MKTYKQHLCQAHEKLVADLFAEYTDAIDIYDHYCSLGDHNLAAMQLERIDSMENEHRQIVDQFEKDNGIYE